LNYYPNSRFLKFYRLRLRESLTHSVLTFVNFGSK